MHGGNYRQPKGMPRTRREFIPGAPQSRIAKFSTGNVSGNYELKLQLISTGSVQIRHNALEAARVAINKKLSSIGEDKYYLAVKVYPHVVLSENKMIATAGADRLQEGMRKAFGKPIGLAARVKAGTILFELSVAGSDFSAAEDALKAGSCKLPVKTAINKAPLEKMIMERGGA